MNPPGPAARPRRSMLYLPGDNPRILDKAESLAADALIFDLEDSVAPERKARAREEVIGRLAEGSYGGRERIVRINGLDTPWGEEDLRAVAQSGADALLLPKVEAPEELHLLEARLKAADAPEKLGLMVMMERPRAILRALELADASPRLTALVVGSSDLGKDLCLPEGDLRPGLSAARSWVVLAARSAGLAALDGIHLTLDDPEGLRAACLEGRALGFDGKTLIHPSGIACANEVFAPSEREIERARGILAAFHAASAGGKSLAVHEGKLVERLHAEAAERLLARVEAIRALAKARTSR